MSCQAYERSPTICMVMRTSSLILIVRIMWCKNFLVSAKNWHTWRLDSSWWNSCTYRPDDDHLKEVEGFRFPGSIKMWKYKSWAESWAGSLQQEPVWVEQSSSRQQWSLRSSETGSALRFPWTTPAGSLREASFRKTERFPRIQCPNLLQKVEAFRK